MPRYSKACLLGKIPLVVFRTSILRLAACAAAQDEACLPSTLSIAKPTPLVLSRRACGGSKDMAASPDQGALDDAAQFPHDRRRTAAGGALQPRRRDQWLALRHRADADLARR